MAKDVATARTLVDLSPRAEELLVSLARPIVLAPARVEVPHVAPDSAELGVMLPHAPIHHLLFAVILVIAGLTEYDVIGGLLRACAADRTPRTRSQRR